MPKNVANVNHLGVPAPDGIFESLHAILHRVRQHQQAQGEAGDLTLLEARVLGFFAHHPGATQGQLAEHSGRDKGQLARLVGGLRERGLLEARPDPADRRVTRLHLTDAARREHQVVQRQRRRLADAALADFSAAERATLAALLQRLLEALQRPPGHSG